MANRFSESLYIILLYNYGRNKSVDWIIVDHIDLTDLSDSMEIVMIVWNSNQHDLDYNWLKMQKKVWDENNQTETDKNFGARHKISWSVGHKHRTKNLIILKTTPNQTERDHHIVYI